MTKEQTINFDVRIANEGDVHFAEQLCAAYVTSARVRGIGIAKRSQSYLESKIREHKAIIAIANPQAEGESATLAGFCYIESSNHEKFVVNSGLLVLPEFRENGLAWRIKELAFDLSRVLYPNAKIFGLTTSSAVMKINADLGYRPATYSELTDDRKFWDGCKSCVNYNDILVAKDFKHCLCTGMLFDPQSVRRTAAVQKPVLVQEEPSPKSFPLSAEAVQCIK